MAKITYVHIDGRHETLDVPVGSSVMQGATSHFVEGIVGECGGSCICGTCHVFVDPEQLSLLTPMSMGEDTLLNETAVARKANSRLSCQIPVAPSLEGLRVYLPNRQT